MPLGTAKTSAIDPVTPEGFFTQPGPNADKIRIGSPVQWPESQLTANVEPVVAVSRSATAVGPRRLETLAENEPADALALQRGELGEAFAHRPPDTLAL